MATIIKIAPNNNNGQRVLNAAQQIRAGLGDLLELDGLRANAIGAGQTEMQSVFGLTSTDDAQALSDRWAALLYAVYDTGSPNYTAYAFLRDLIDAIALDSA